MVVHCKKCGGRRFYGISALRKHQWKQHPEHYEKRLATIAAKRRHKAPRMSVRESKELAKLEVLTNGNGTLSAAQLLGQLKDQQKFMNDVVNLVGGLIAQHEVNK